MQLILVMQILFVDHVCFETYFKDVNLIIFDKIIHKNIPHLLLTLVVTDNNPFHVLVIFIVFSASCFATALQALTNFFYIQFLSTCIYIVMMVTILLDYDDRFLGGDFPFSCLGHSAVFSFYVDLCCIYFGVKNMIF